MNVRPIGSRRPATLRSPLARSLGRTLSTALLTATLGCSSDATTAPSAGTPAITGDAVAGLEAFQGECASCHASRDGFDLGFFAFPDTTIVRRAVAHVDTSTAHDIVAYIRTVRADPTARDFRVFQPGDEVLWDDAAFALRVFGADAWPSDLSAHALAAIDPLEAPIALEFPLWSSEATSLDWMPDVPIENALLDYPTEAGVARELVERYHATHALDDLLGAVLALRIADRDPMNPEAPCVMEPFDRFRAEACFETRRWIASFGATHMLRTGERDAVHPILHDAWWDVGNAARRARQTGQPVDDPILNWAQWMYVGWAFEPDRHASVYLSTALNALGLPRHATFHALRAMVVRGPVGRAAFMDVRTAARFAPHHWTYEAVGFGYEHLLDRLEGGVRFRRQEDLDEARRAVEEAWAIAARKLGADDGADLAALRDRVLAGLDGVVVG